jgi:hypothetical protein
MSLEYRLNQPRLDSASILAVLESHARHPSYEMARARNCLQNRGVSDKSLPDECTVFWDCCVEACISQLTHSANANCACAIHMCGKFDDDPVINWKLMLDVSSAFLKRSSAWND